MGTALIYLLVMVVVAGVLFWVAATVFGRGEELAPLPPGRTVTELPEHDVRGDDVRALRFQQVLRGYKAAEVDWALARLAGEVDQLRAELAQVRPSGAGDRREGGSRDAAAERE
ncbi:DivIVA domain-containing protein [Rhodococcus sp. X156]|uniref:DivIVA domain-containing protein n=1 Tax=Rhodococcus sp. X156 TaxID=2499145 RepID=UPI000FD99606|nr:DivIVA domain-containing protein [Rhodococcus sp. X156]